MNKKCLIVGAADFNNPPPGDFDFVIAADGGLETLRKFSIKPDITVGDFDSLGFVPDGENVITLPVKKDVSDMYRASEIAVSKGFRELHFYGGMGGRPDHTYANIAMLASLSQRGISAFLYSDDYVITAITNGEFSFTAQKAGTVSVFSFTDTSEGVTERGLLYSLENTSLENSFPLGLSNSFTKQDGIISVKNGTLIIMYEI